MPCFGFAQNDLGLALGQGGLCNWTKPTLA